MQLAKALMRPIHLGLHIWSFLRVVIGPRLGGCSWGGYTIWGKGGKLR